MIGKLDWSWVKRRWWDFRNGHSIYLAFILSFINFIVLNYTLLISNIRFLTNIFPHLWIFGLTFLLTYPPLAILVGEETMKKSSLFLVGFASLGILAFYFRISDAISHGDWALAFVTDSFMGFPLAHILTLPALLLLFLAVYTWDKENPKVKT